MEENNVFHLAKILQNTDSARNELQTFLQAMQTRVEQDYLQKIQAAAALQQADAVEHPPREVTLLRALGAFTCNYTFFKIFLIQIVCSGSCYAD